MQTEQTVDNVGRGGRAMVGCTVAVTTAATCTASNGTWEIARSTQPVGAFGGFLNLGLPLSRWFNADPKGRNAGWQLYLHAGKDQVVHTRSATCARESAAAARTGDAVQWRHPALAVADCWRRLFTTNSTRGRRLRLNNRSIRPRLFRTSIRCT